MFLLMFMKLKHVYTGGVSLSVQFYSPVTSTSSLFLCSIETRVSKFTSSISPCLTFIKNYKQAQSVNVGSAHGASASDKLLHLKVIELLTSESEKASDKIEKLSGVNSSSSSSRPSSHIALAKSWKLNSCAFKLFSFEAQKAIGTDQRLINLLLMKALVYLRHQRESLTRKLHLHLCCNYDRSDCFEILSMSTR